MKALDLVKQWPVDNFAAAVIDGDDIHRVGDLGKVFHLMSVTKPLSAYGFLMAVEEGIFELDTPLGPEGSTVRHLLAHASGVGFNADDRVRTPGERRIYSNHGFQILADAVTDAAGMDFAEYLRQGVMEPLGMEWTRLRGEAGWEAEGTAHDLITFLLELMHPTLLHPSTIAEATTVQFPDLNGIVPGYGMMKPCPWGLGFEIKGAKDPHWTGPNMPADTFGHFGQSGTYLWVAPNTGRAMVALTDRPFGDWAKPLWSETNAAIWEELAG